MAGQWVMTKKNGRKYTTPFTFSSDEVDNIRYNSPKGETYEFINANFKRKRITGAGMGVSKLKKSR